MVGELRQQRQRRDPRQAAADEAEVERRDRDAGEGAAASRSHPGAVEHERPSEREGKVHRYCCGEQPVRLRLAGSRSVPAAYAASNGSRPLASACTVDGSPLSAAATPAARRTRKTEGYACRVSVQARDQESAEERVTPLELFFDLIFVFAITQVTGIVVDDPTWAGLAKGLLVLGVLWWAWAAYAWLTNTINPEEGAVRIAMFAAMGAMLIASLAVPDVFGDDAFLFACAYAFVRIAHLALYAIAGRGDRDLLAAVARLGVGTVIGVGLLFVAAASTAGSRSRSGRLRSRSTCSAPTSAGAAAGVSPPGTSPSGTG